MRKTQYGSFTETNKLNSTNKKIDELANKKMAKMNDSFKIKKIVQNDFGTTTKNKMENIKIYEDEHGNKEVFKQTKIQKIHDDLDKAGWRRVNPNIFLSVLIKANFNLVNIKILKYILEKMNTKNEIVITQAEIIEILGVGKNSVVDTFKNLKELNVLKKIKGKYIFNPYVISNKGNNTEEIAQLHEFYLPDFKHEKKERELTEELNILKERMARVEAQIKKNKKEEERENIYKEKGENEDEEI